MVTTDSGGSQCFREGSFQTIVRRPYPLSWMLRYFREFCFRFTGAASCCFKGDGRVDWDRCCSMKVAQTMAVGWFKLVIYSKFHRNFQKISLTDFTRNSARISLAIQKISWSFSQDPQKVPWGFHLKFTWGFLQKFPWGFLQELPDGFFQEFPWEFL